MSVSLVGAIFCYEVKFTSSGDQSRSKAACIIYRTSNICENDNHLFKGQVFIYTYNLFCQINLLNSFVLIIYKLSFEHLYTISVTQTTCVHR